MYCCSSNMVYKQIKMDMVSFNNFNLGKSSCCTRNLFPHRSYDRSTCDACHHHDARSLLLHLHCSARLRPRMWIPRVCSLSTSKRPPPQYHCLQSRHRLCLFCSTPPWQSLSWHLRWQKLDGCLFFDRSLQRQSNFSCRCPRSSSGRRSPPSLLRRIQRTCPRICSRILKMILKAGHCWRKRFQRSKQMSKNKMLVLKFYPSFVQQGIF